MFVFFRVGCPLEVDGLVRSSKFSLDGLVRSSKCTGRDHRINAAGDNDNIFRVEPNSSDSRISNVGRNDCRKCIYSNARSIKNKLPELELLIKEENIDLLGISETDLNDI